MSVISTEGLTKHFGPTVAVDALDLDIAQGEVFGFLGPNGAGKTTTIRMLLDLLRPTAGSVKVLGCDPRTNGVEMRQHIGYVPGEFSLYERLRVDEILRYLGSLRPHVDWTLVDGLCTRLHLDRNAVVSSLSKGNKQKVGLVQALMSRPKLLILDEPTDGIDPLIQQEFYSVIHENVADGCTVFLSSHVLSEVQHVAKRVGIIRSGKLVAVESVDDLRERSARQITVSFAEPIAAETFVNISGLTNVEVVGKTLRALSVGEDDALVKALSKYRVIRYLASEPDLEDVFLSYYAGPDNS